MKCQNINDITIKINNFLEQKEFEKNSINKKMPGLYLIYVKNKDKKIIYEFEDTILLPFYIGKTIAKTGIAGRFSQHKTQIKKILNEYKEFGIEETEKSGRWDGKHFYSKIATFLYANNLSYEDVDYKIIKSVNKNFDNNKLEEMETNLIEDLELDKYGWNQISFIIHWHKLVNFERSAAYSNKNANQLDKEFGLIFDEIIKEYVNTFYYITTEKMNNYFNKGYYTFNLSNLCLFMQQFYASYILEYIDLNDVQGFDFKNSYTILKEFSQKVFNFNQKSYIYF